MQNVHNSELISPQEYFSSITTSIATSLVTKIIPLLVFYYIFDKIAKVISA